MSSLNQLNLVGNSFIWNVSLDWVPPFRLSVLSLQSCNMGPHLPEWLLFPSKPTSSIQSENSHLVFLDLSNNLFSGALPNRTMHMQNLRFLNLSYNKFPTSIGSLSGLRTPNLANNAFSGEFPLSLKNCTSLRFGELRGNKLSGNMPTWIGESLSSLAFLRLQSNEFNGSIQILDLSLNHINGTIPQCLKNITAVTQRDPNNCYYLRISGILIDRVAVLWKGRKYLFGENLGQYMMIDLSSNKLEGMIPKEISSILMLNQLNLSNNKLSGTIPEEIGGLKQWESLDLPQNQLSGRIPATMSNLNFLTTLNISRNNLSGRIPLSTQLQSFDASAIIGNPALCGLPLTFMFPGDDTPQHPPPKIGGQYNEEDGDEFMEWFYTSMAFGFILGFWGVSGTLLLNHSCRHAFFQLLDKFGDWLYVTIKVYSRRLQQKFRNFL